MEIINGNNVSDCIYAWIKELELSGFSKFVCDIETIDSIKNEPFNHGEKLFIVEDPFCEIQDKDIIKIFHEDNYDDNSGLIGQCTVILHNGFDLW